MHRILGQVLDHRWNGINAKLEVKGTPNPRSNDLSEARELNHGMTSFLRSNHRVRSTPFPCPFFPTTSTHVLQPRTSTERFRGRKSKDDRKENRFGLSLAGKHIDGGWTSAEMKCQQQRTKRPFVFAGADTPCPFPYRWPSSRCKLRSEAGVFAASRATRPKGFQT